MCDAFFSNCANPLECPVNLFGMKKNLINIKFPLFCLNSMRLSAFCLICTLSFIWRNTGFSALFFIHKHFLVDLFREKKLFFFSFLALLRFYCPKQTTQKHTFYNFSQWRKKLFSSAFGALFFFVPSFITDKFKFCFYWPSWSLRISLYLTAFIIFVSKVESTI